MSFIEQYRWSYLEQTFSPFNTPPSVWLHWDRFQRPVQLFTFLDKVPLQIQLRKKKKKLRRTLQHLHLSIARNNYFARRLYPRFAIGLHRKRIPHDHTYSASLSQSNWLVQTDLQLSHVKRRNDAHHLNQAIRYAVHTRISLICTHFYTKSKRKRKDVLRQEEGESKGRTYARDWHQRPMNRCLDRPPIVALAIRCSSRRCTAQWFSQDQHNADPILAACRNRGTAATKSWTNFDFRFDSSRGNFWLVQMILLCSQYDCWRYRTDWL